jgi:16S rRNA (guanine527-N7)-methyltransferase
MDAASAPDTDAAVLEDGLVALGLDPALAPRLLDYRDLLARWNRTYNLTAVRDPAQMVPRHLLDSLALAPQLAALAARGGHLADLGTGPGLPGIPLAIALPGLRVALVESNGKKARFLREAVRVLAVDNADVVESRIEAWDPPLRFDAITARALATIPRILELGGHLLASGGRLLAMKGQRPDEELAALPGAWRVASLQPLAVPGADGERHLVVVERA